MPMIELSPIRGVLPKEKLQTLMRRRAALPRC